MYKIHFIGTSAFVLLSKKEMDKLMLEDFDKSCFIWVNEQKELINIDNIAFISKSE